MHWSDKDFIESGSLKEWLELREKVQTLRDAILELREKVKTLQESTNTANREVWKLRDTLIKIHDSLVMNNATNCFIIPTIRWRSLPYMNLDVKAYIAKILRG